MFIRLLFFLFFVNAGICLSQNCLDTILLREPYSSSNDIINGRKWKYEKKYKGSPLLTEDYWPEADILYNGVHFTGKLMNYDLQKNELIIYYPQKGKEKYLVLSNDKLSGFSFNDSLLNRTRIFEYIELPDFQGKILYENASVGNLLLFIKPIKKKEISSGGKSIGQFTNYYEYYLNPGDGYARVSSKNQLIRLLSNHTTDLKRYIRENKIKINNQNPQNVVDVVMYYNELK